MAASAPTLTPFGTTEGYLARTEDETTITITQAVDPEVMAGFEITSAEIYGDGQFISMVFTKKHPSA